MKEKKQNKAPTKPGLGMGELTDMVLLYGNRRVVIRGCRKILSYAPEEIRIAQRERIVCLTGKGLCCVSFAAGSATVEGILHTVQLEEREGKEKRP